MATVTRQQWDITPLTEAHGEHLVQTPDLQVYRAILSGKHPFLEGCQVQFWKSPKPKPKVSPMSRLGKRVRESDGVKSLTLLITMPLDLVPEHDDQSFFFKTLEEFKQLMLANEKDHIAATYLDTAETKYWIVPFVWLHHFQQKMAPAEELPELPFRELPSDCKDLTQLLQALVPRSHEVLTKARVEQRLRQISMSEALRPLEVSGLLGWIDIKLLSFYQPVVEYWSPKSLADYRWPLGPSALHWKEFMRGDIKTVVSFQDQGPDEIRIDLTTACHLAVEVEVNMNRLRLQEAWEWLQILQRNRCVVDLRVVSQKTGEQQFMSMMIFGSDFQSFRSYVSAKRKDGYRVWSQRPAETGDWLWVSRSPENPATPRLLLKAVVAPRSCMPDHVGVHPATLEELLGGDFDGDQVRLAQVHNPCSLLHHLLLSHGYAGLDIPKHHKGQRLLCGQLLLLGLTDGDCTSLEEAADLKIQSGETALEAIIREQIQKQSPVSTTQILESLPKGFVENWPHTSSDLGKLWRLRFGPAASTQLWCRLEEIENLISLMLPPISPLEAIGHTPDRALYLQWAEAQAVDHVRAAPAALRAELQQHAGYVQTAIERLPWTFVQRILDILELTTSTAEDQERVNQLLEDLSNVTSTEESPELRLLRSGSRWDATLAAIRSEMYGVVPKVAGLGTRESYGWNGFNFNAYKQGSVTKEASAATVHRSNQQWVNKDKAKASHEYDHLFGLNGEEEHLGRFTDQQTGSSYVWIEDVDQRGCLILSSTRQQLLGLSGRGLMEHVPFGYLKDVQAEEPDSPIPRQTPAHRHHFWAGLFGQGLRPSTHVFPSPFVEVWRFKDPAKLALVVYLNEISEKVTWGSLECQDELLYMLRELLDRDETMSQELHGKLHLLAVCAAKVQAGACKVVRRTMEVWGVKKIPCIALSLQEHLRNGLLGWLKKPFLDSLQRIGAVLPSGITSSMVPGLLDEETDGESEASESDASFDEDPKVFEKLKRQPIMLLEALNCFCEVRPFPPSKKKSDSLRQVLQELTRRSFGAPSRQYLEDPQQYCYQHVPLRLAVCLRTQDNLPRLIQDFTVTDMSVKLLESQMISEGQMTWSLQEPLPKLFHDPDLPLSCDHSEVYNLVPVSRLGSPEVSYIPSGCSECHMYDRGIPLSIREAIMAWPSLKSQQAAVLLAFDHAADLPRPSFTMLLARIMLPMRLRFVKSIMGRLWFLAYGTAQELWSVWSGSNFRIMLENRSLCHQPENWPRRGPEMSIDLLQKQEGMVTLGIRKGSDAISKAQKIVIPLRATQPVDAPLVDQKSLALAQGLKNELGSSPDKLAGARRLYIKRLRTLPGTRAFYLAWTRRKPELKLSKLNNFDHNLQQKVRSSGQIRFAQQDLVGGRASSKIGPVHDPEALARPCLLDDPQGDRALCAFNPMIYVSVVDYYSFYHLEVAFGVSHQIGVGVSLGLAALVGWLPVPYRGEQDETGAEDDGEEADKKAMFVDFHGNKWTYNNAELYVASALMEPGQTGRQGPVPMPAFWNGKLAEEFDVVDEGLTLLLLLASKMTDKVRKGANSPMTWQSLISETQVYVEECRRLRKVSPPGVAITLGRDQSRLMRPVIYAEQFLKFSTT